jgi:hypothetical protein
MNSQSHDDDHPISRPPAVTLDLADNSKRPARRAVDVPRLTYGIDEVARALGISRSGIERVRRAGRFPRPDLMIGKRPFWRVETIHRYIENGARP